MWISRRTSPSDGFERFLELRFTFLAKMINYTIEGDSFIKQTIRAFICLEQFTIILACRLLPLKVSLLPVLCIYLFIENSSIEVSWDKYFVSWITFDTIEFHLLSKGKIEEIIRKDILGAVCNSRRGITKGLYSCLSTPIVDVAPLIAWILQERDGQVLLVVIGI